MPWTEEQKEYAQRVTIATLIGGLGGALVGQFASEPATMGKTALGAVLGAGLAGAGYGIFLRGGPEKEQFAGVGQHMRPRRFPGRRSRRAPLRECVGGIGSPYRYPHMRLGKIGSMVQRLGTATCAGCTPNKMAGYEIARKGMLGQVGALRGTYEVKPGSCWEG